MPAFDAFRFRAAEAAPARGPGEAFAKMLLERLPERQPACR
jgi:hypothetical protein